MSSKVLKIIGIVALVGFVLFGAVEFWVYKNREKLFRSAQELINENLNGNLAIGDFKFRPFYGGLGLNFTLYDVKLTDTLYNVHHKPFLEAGKIHVAIDFKRILSGDVRIKNLVLEDGGLKLFVQKDGYSNLSIFKSDGDDNKKKDSKKTDDGIIKKLGNIRFLNFGVAYSDSVKEKYFGALFRDATNIIERTDSSTNASFTGSVFFNGLTFKVDKGSFLKNQETTLALVLAYNEDEKKLKIYPSILESATHSKIGINGVFDFSDTIKVFTLNFEAKGIAVKDALPLLNTRLQKQIDSIGVQTNVDTQVKIAGILGRPGLKPQVDVHFETDTFRYNLPVGVLRKMKASGTFTNRADTTKLADVYNSRLIAPKITGFFETIPFAFKLVVNNFRNPRADIDGRIEADSTNMGALLDPSRYRFKHGSARIDFHFSGNLKRFYNAGKDNFDGKVVGKVALKNIAMDYLPQKVSVSKINGDLTFNEKVMVLPNLRFSDGQNMLYVRGTLLDLIPYLFGSPKSLRANVDVNIPDWQLNWLEPLLAAKSNSKPKSRSSLKLSELLDNAIDKMEIVAKLDAKKVRYRNFTGRDVKGQLTISNNAVSIEYFQLKAFGAGRVRLSGEMDNAGSGKLPHMAVRARIENADVHSVFYSFDNFGQKTLTHQNLKGILNTNFSFESTLNNNVKLVPESMKGLLRIDLTNAYIINFEPFMKMKKLIFKKRNFERVKFAPIRNDFRLTGQEIDIAPMEIESNLLTLFIDGIYSFGNKTDINIQIPLSNLKKRDSTYVLDPNNPEKREGSKIFLRAIDENGEVNIKLAFRRKKKDKSKEDESEVKKLEEVER
ncbi:AsmA-like C-terminal region-containing protein [Dyadobacter sp. CY261]|uniref:AsmA-like C-terminal region-containing protein n=1 Tax=Dyadobacter sp. CY261 TaxID=2907203 RepID=UPI001F45A0DC|nr:AsmA-like C-terminal region-containing protein [Dyadobacter sp. CY261]MCF0072497.1 AsmA-like C-terminal region-containing protein [Dyadobacter sp. CY261]